MRGQCSDGLPRATQDLAWTSFRRARHTFFQNYQEKDHHPCLRIPIPSLRWSGGFCLCWVFPPPPPTTVHCFRPKRRPLASRLPKAPLPGPLPGRAHRLDARRRCREPSAGDGAEAERGGNCWQAGARGPGVCE